MGVEGFRRPARPRWAEIARSLGRRLQRTRILLAPPDRAVAFGLSLAALALAIRFLTGDTTPRFLFLYPTVAIAALVGGPIAGIAATALTALAATVFFFEPVGSLAVAQVGDLVSIGNFFGTGLLISLVASVDRVARADETARADREIDAAEDRRRTIVTALHDGVMVFAPDGRVLDANPSAERMLRRSLAEMQAAPSDFSVWGLVGEDGAAMAVADYPVVRVLRTGAPAHGEVVGIPIGGEVMWILNNADPLRDPETGEIVAAVVSFNDVTERRRIRADLAESRARFAAIVDTAMDAIVAVDEERRIVLFNAAAERVFGCPFEEARRRSLSDFVPERLRAAYDEAMNAFAAEALAGGPSARAVGRSGQLFAARLDGSEFPVEASVSVLATERGRLVTLVLRDITERLAAERLNARLATVVTSSAAAIFTVGMDGRIETWNDGAVAMLGWRPQDIVGQPVGILSFPDRPDGGTAIYHRVRAGEAVSVETVRRRADGSAIEVSSTATPVRDAAGAVIAGAVIMTDIGERRRNERRLAERGEELRQTLDAAGVGVWWLDVAGDRVHGDPRSLAHFGVAEAASWDALVALFPDDGETLRALHATLSTTGTTALTARRRTPEGNVVWLALTARLRVGEGGEDEIWGTVHDVTEARAAEQALRRLEESRRLEALGRMTGGIAHDFNNLLTVISGNLQLLETTVAGDPGRRWIAEALRATETGAALNHRLTTFARRRRLAPVVTDLGDRLGAMVDLLRRSVGADVTLLTALAADPWPVRVDPAEIENAVLNLVFNARDALPDGGRSVVETRNVEVDADVARGQDGAKPGAYVRLSVSDDGIGMAADVRARAFEPFFTTKPLGRGTGLGLATLHGFVRQSGGFVTLYSEPGRGTTVNVYLPRCDAAEPAAVVDPPPVWGAGQTILVVEDDPGVARVTVERLIALGYRVEAVASAAAALARLAEDRPVDLVFSDVMMPGGLSGLDLARRLARSDRPPPIVLTTGFAEEIVRSDVDRTIEFPVLRKPWSQSDLARAVADALASGGADAAQSRDTSPANT